MNKLIFCIDEYDTIISINYNEEYDENIKSNNIILNQDKAKMFFNKFKKLFPNFIQNIEEDYIEYVFYNVDVNLIDKMIEQSDNQDELLNDNQKKKSKKERKIKRRNKFKNVFVSVDDKVLSVLELFCIPKTTENNNELELPDLNEMVEEIEESINNNAKKNIKIPDIINIEN